MLLPILAVLIVLFVVLPLIGMALWAVLTTVVVGVIIGGVARLVIPGAQPIGFLPTVAAGLSGSILGGFLGQHVWGIGRFPTVLVEIGVAAVVVLVLSSLQHRRLRSSQLPNSRF